MADEPVSPNDERAKRSTVTAKAPWRKRWSKREASVEPDEDDHKATFYQGMLGWLAALGLVFLLAMSIGSDVSWHLAFGTVAIAAFGAFFAGGLLGFLFGVPRAPDRSTTPGPTECEDSSQYQPNTNLEQVSDWLTKILLGAGLTQIRAIGSFFVDVGGALGDAVDLPQASMTAAIVFYVVIGFHFFYVWTRLYLPELFVEAEMRARRQAMKQAPRTPGARAHSDQGPEATS